VLVQVRLLLAGVLSPLGVLAAVLGAVDGAKALVDALAVVARRPLVVRLTRLPLEALRRTAGRRRRRLALTLTNV